MIMKKVSVPVSNSFCPQTLFLYGTYKEDGAPNFGLFCWFSYCWDKELHVMACIGGEKLTKDLIHKNGVFSANLVNRPLLPLADYLGNKEGYEADKMDVVDASQIIPGEILKVPVLVESPWSYELEVKQFLPMDDGEVMICRIRNVLADEKLTAKEKSFEELFYQSSPIITTGGQVYFSTGEKLGNWGDWKK